MNTNIDFRNVWRQQKISQPSMEVFLAKLDQYKKKGIRNLVIINILLWSTAVIITLIWYYFQPQFITTKIGMLLVILGMLIFIVAYNQLFGFYKTTSTAKSNHDYLNDLMNYKIKQKHLQTTMMQLYFILLSLGIGLYLFEYVHLMDLIWGIATYVITFAWLVFNWVYLRPKIISKQQEKLDFYVETLEKITKQLEKTP